MPLTNESWNVGYTLRDDNSNDVKSINMSWERQSPAQIMQNLNTFLVAVGAPLKVVSSK